MPAITRSHTRKMIEDLKTSPYSISVRNLAKIEQPKVSAKLEKLLNREDTPETQEITHTLLELSDRSMRAKRRVDTERSMVNGLHTVGDILYKCLTPVRKHIYTQTKKMYLPLSTVGPEIISMMTPRRRQIC